MDNVILLYQKHILSTSRCQDNSHIIKAFGGIKKHSATVSILYFSLYSVTTITILKIDKYALGFKKINSCKPALSLYYAVVLMGWIWAESNSQQILNAPEL